MVYCSTVCWCESAGKQIDTEEEGSKECIEDLENI